MIKQSISPNRKIFFAGETVSFFLTGINSRRKGRAVLRTNIGRSAIQRQEVIEKNEHNRTPRGGDWHDIELDPSENGYEVTLPLAEPGIFEAKCCFIPADGTPVIWASGDNFRLKVHPANSVTANGIYCAFVRQFGKWIDLPHSPEIPESVNALDRENYTVVPPSGTFRDLIARLDHIFGTLRCNILQLLPIHPVPKCFGRMGRYGSPFAATDYFSVDPALAEFDTAATPMEQFRELIDAVHARRGRIFMDIPVNHTGWASKLQCEHPDYFRRNTDGTFVSPGAWGIIWADLCQLDYSNTKVRDVMAKVFLFWCRHGVDGFRCDAGYMVPREAWQYIIAKVRTEFPDTVFLLEGLGGPPAVQEELLGKIGLDWGYSELFQNYSRDEITSYFQYLDHVSSTCGIMANFAETHDNDRLAKKGKIYARLRFLVNALLARNGAFGFANGAEFFATEKIDVHGCGGLNFGDPDNLCHLIGRLNTLMATHPAFGAGVTISLIQHGGGNVIAAKRSGENIPELLILLNLDCENPAVVNFTATGFTSGKDLLSERQVALISHGNQQSVRLAPGEGLCVSFNDFTLPEIPAASNAYPEMVLNMLAQEMAQRAAVHFTNLKQAAQADGKLLLADPVKFTAAVSGITPPPVTTWNFPKDITRVVMLPPGDLLLIKAPANFIAGIYCEGKTLVKTTSLPYADGSGEFSLLHIPGNTGSRPRELQLHICSFADGVPDRREAVILQLADPDKRMVKLAGKYSDAAHHYVFGANDLGGYAMFSAQWGVITGKYDALLAANVNPEYPVDRRVMFTACRSWLVINEFSQELTAATLESYRAHPGNRAQWQFLLPDGLGGHLTVTVEFRMALDRNAVELRFRRENDGSDRQIPAKLILRPDIEDRVNHTTVRACDGAEHHFREVISEFADGFSFRPGDCEFKMRLAGGKFFRAPEWRYMIDLPQERYYGMNDKNDLFSPGYFTVPLNPGAEVILCAGAGDTTGAHYPALNVPDEIKPEVLASDALSRFVVKRDGLSTVIAGYPWFLDWGRDTLIVLRGLCKFPEFHRKCANILQCFAAFEKGGTIPNMICGGNDSNRDTSDAPLYLIAAARDYIEASGDQQFMDHDCGGRTMREVMNSIVDNYCRGTANGIQMDPASGLIFSPSHFSWMDTNFPAGTPREGYPVEIQALWLAALEFLGRTELAQQVKNSIAELYFHNGKVSDCLHCKRGTPAAQASPDDHLRCNMLLLITMRAVTDPDKTALILSEAEKLLIPGAIRTLDDAPVEWKLPVALNGHVLNNPGYPYQGYYRGPEDTSRKMAYHNGTAWCWPFPAYCEALYMLGGQASRLRAKALLYSCVDHLENGVIGEMPEVLDGNAPHRTGGCMAQAWSVSEFYRVMKILEQKK